MDTESSMEEEWYARLVDYEHELDQAKRLNDANAVDKLSNLVNNLDAILVPPRHPRVALIGRRGLGKSTLINRILRSPIVPVGYFDTTTSTVTEIISWSRDVFTVVVEFVTETWWSNFFTQGMEGFHKNGENDQSWLALLDAMLVFYPADTQRVWMNKSALSALPEDIQLLVQTRFKIYPCEASAVAAQITACSQHDQRLWPVVSKLTLWGNFPTLSEAGVSLLDIPGMSDGVTLMEQRCYEAASGADQVFHLCPFGSEMLTLNTIQMLTNQANLIRDHFGLVMTHAAEILPKLTLDPLNGSVFSSAATQIRFRLNKKVTEFFPESAQAFVSVPFFLLENERHTVNPDMFDQFWSCVKVNAGDTLRPERFEAAAALVNDTTDVLNSPLTLALDTLTFTMPRLNRNRFDVHYSRLQRLFQHGGAWMWLDVYAEVILSIFSHQAILALHTAICEGIVLRQQPLTTFSSREDFFRGILDSGRQSLLHFESYFQTMYADETICFGVGCKQRMMNLIVNWCEQHRVTLCKLVRVGICTYLTEKVTQWNARHHMLLPSLSEEVLTPLRIPLDTTDFSLQFAESLSILCTPPRMDSVSSRGSRRIKHPLDGTVIAVRRNDTGAMKLMLQQTPPRNTTLLGSWSSPDRSQLVNVVRFIFQRVRHGRDWCICPELLFLRVVNWVHEAILKHRS